MSDFRLEQHERHSPLWVRLEQWAMRELAILREQNDKPQPEADTAFRRGRIKQLKDFIALGAEPKV